MPMRIATGFLALRTVAGQGMSSDLKNAAMVSTSDVDKMFTQATDNLIALYRGIERRTLDLPLISFMPVLISLWAGLRFVFFLYVGLVLIIPTNLVIFLRNRFPGHWRYRPFFLRHLHYFWLWIWRGEAPTTPSIFIRPFLNIFMKGHFDRRLRRLRSEILLRDELSDATRSALLARLDAALERWKPARFQVFLFSALFPAVFSFPNGWKAWIELLKSLGFQIPADLAGNLVVSPGVAIIFAMLAIGYILTIPITAFMAKRGLFIGSEGDMIYFPGGQAGCGAYLKEKEILHGVGLHAREPSVDLWLLAFAVMVSLLFLLFTWDIYIATLESIEWLGRVGVRFDYASKLPNLIAVVFIGLLLPVAMLRRSRAGRV
jgi:hypothetical protein